MRTVSISVTDASRNFADCVNRTRYQGTTFVLHKSGVPVAQIVPVKHNSKISGDLDNHSSEVRGESQHADKAAGNPDSLRGSGIW
jgi:prevent-host-death family protein